MVRRQEGKDGGSWVGAHRGFEALDGLLKHLHGIAAHEALIVKLLCQLDHSPGIDGCLVYREAEAEADGSRFLPTACGHT